MGLGGSLVGLPEKEGKVKHTQLQLNFMGGVLLQCWGYNLGPLACWEHALLQSHALCLLNSDKQQQLVI